ncbi:CCR4-NOT core subunit cdc39 [Zygosaccharomyces mellis]|uniref:General negative regulator of transcription subunit 1 n=1 Tax=Zygosaccharomyces mellis TaxID=42258 RepID=A0A4C2E1W3_9SACH|nr:CCR4-NOT core subunit cdc39 [Zygosaccharomyces mellis]
MQSAALPKDQNRQEKEAIQIISSQISLLITSLTPNNYTAVSRNIDFLLKRSGSPVYVKYWKRLLTLCSNDIKNTHRLESPEQNLIHGLLGNLIFKIQDKVPSVWQLLRSQVFENIEFLSESGLETSDISQLLQNQEVQQPNYKKDIEKLEQVQNIKMNNAKYLQTFLADCTVANLANELTDLLFSLSGEARNDMIALMMSEIISPGSQKLQSDYTNSWFTPLTIPEATNIGYQISKVFKHFTKENVNWNRIFNLMSTKYFLGTLIKPSTASLSSFFACLETGPLIDQFFSCDWDSSFKLQIACLLHHWSPQQSCFDLLKVEGIKKVTDVVPNSKQSPLYLMSVASLDLELFLLRDELVNHPMLPYYQECFFEDFNLVPESLAFALVADIKHFTLLIENSTIIDEILVTLLVQVFEKSPMVMGILIKSISDNEKIVDAAKIIINKETLPIANFVKILADEGRLDYVIARISFTDVFRILPSARKVGWDGFGEFVKNNLDVNTAPVILDCLDTQTKMTDANTTFKSSKIFDLAALSFLINLLIDFPLRQFDRDRFESIQFSLIIAFPRLINFGYGHDEAILADGGLVPFTTEVEKEMQSYLQKMYSGELAIKDIIDVLRRLRDSDDAKDQDVFACITHAVITESSFFRDYPLDALATTSVLFGSMILFQLLRGFVLDVAFKIILNFAKEGPDSKMFKFAIQAIYAFKIRLTDFPQYCKDLLEQVPHLQNQPQVYQAVIDATVQAHRRVQNFIDESKPAVEMIPLRFFNVEEPLSQAHQEAPPKEIMEKVLFVVNNITMDNFDSKITDLKPVLIPNYFSWFSNYLVNQRAKTEPNYHKLYSRLLATLGSNLLHEYMISVTLKQLFVMLATKDIQSIDKNHLKNLSSWLGSITIAIDRPIKHKHIAFREMLLDAYHAKRLEVVVPFVARILQNASESKVFRPPNPWTLGILKVLVELNAKADWKLSLTFEVEVLLKAFDLKPGSVEPSSFLSMGDITEELSGALSKMTIEQQQSEQQRQMILMQQYQQQMLLFHQRQQRLVNAGMVPPMDHLPMAATSTAVESTPVNDNPFSNLFGTTIFVTHPDLKRVLQMAIAKSVRENLLPTVEMASSIAVVTTLKIVLKDFATEVDEVKLKTAAVTMVRHLAQSLARATSVEILKEGVRSTTQSLAPNLMSLPTSPVEELDTAINDNIGLAVGLVERATIDKAVQDVGEQLLQPIAIRRYHKERRTDQPFMSQNTNPYSLALPEPLGLRTTGVSNQQFKIYENAGKFTPGVDAAAAATAATTTMPNLNVPSLQQTANQQMLLQAQQPRQQPQQPQMSQGNQQIPQHGQGQIPIPNQPVPIPNELEQNHRVLVHLMDGLVVQIKENAEKRSLEDLGNRNPIKAIIFQILTFIARSAQKDQLALKVSQAVVNSLFATSESSLCREVLSLLLEKLCSLSIVARKDVVWWLVYALDSRKFNVSVIRSLLEVNLIDATELDKVLVTAMENRMENSIEFSMRLIQDTVLSDSPILMRMDFICTLEYLGSLDDFQVKNFFNDYENRKVLPVKEGTQITNNERYYLVFTEWVKLLQRVSSDDVVTSVFVRQLMEKGVITSTDKLIEFIRAAIELSVFSFKESDPTGEVFTTIDALGKLVIKLMLSQDLSSVSRTEYLNMILSVIALVFSKDHEEDNTTFNERPYFRLLSNLLYEWETIRGHNFIKIREQKTRKEFISFDTDFYKIFSSYLHCLQPIAFPGFSFAWVTLISHRMFLPTVLRLPEKSGWKNLTLLLIDLLNFLNQYTHKNEIPNAVSVVYKGVLRVLLGISNDVPEYLIENHHELMNNLPSTYFQLKNVILSAIPKKMILPNPYDPGLSMESIDLCQEPPKVYYDPVHDLKSLKKPVDNYLRIPSNSLLRTVVSGLYRAEYEMRNGVGYDYFTTDMKLVRAIVLHVGLEAGLENQKMSSSAVFNTKSSYYTLLFNLIHEGVTELKYQIIQVMIEQLRYPNSHTYWFSYALKNMFVSENWGGQRSEVQEIILRALLERIIVNRPHAWGVSVLFSQLLRGKDVNLLELPFVKKFPEINVILSQLHKHLSLESKSSQQENGTTELS